jgi:hypothetical protein
MTEDELKQALALEEPPLTPSERRLSRLALGTISSDDLAELRAWAESSEEGMSTMDAYSPLGDEFIDRTTNHLYRLRERDRTEAALRPSESPKTAVASVSGWRAWFSWRPGLLLAAAAFAVVIVMPTGDPQPPAWSSHQMELVGDKVMRGEDTQSQVKVARGSTLSVVVRPEQIGGSGEPSFAVFVDSVPVSPSIEPRYSGQGGFEFRLVIGKDIEATVGSHELRVVLAAEGEEAIESSREELRQPFEIIP